MTILLFVFAADKAGPGLRWGGMAAIIVGFLILGIVMWFATGSKQCQLRSTETNTDAVGLRMDLARAESDLDFCNSELNMVQNMGSQFAPSALALQNAQQRANRDGVPVPLTLNFGSSLPNVRTEVLPNNRDTRTGFTPRGFTTRPTSIVAQQAEI